MSVFNLHEAKTQFSHLLARAEAGEENVIAPNLDNPSKTAFNTSKRPQGDV